MKLDYKIEVDEENLTLILTILEQDERFWKKEDDNNDDSIKYECKNGSIIRSNCCVALYSNKIHLKGYDIDDVCDSIFFSTLEKLNEYKQQLIEALEEFKAYEPDDETTQLEKLIDEYKAKQRELLNKYNDKLISLIGDFEIDLQDDNIYIEKDKYLYKVVDKKNYKNESISYYKSKSKYSKEEIIEMCEEDCNDNFLYSMFPDDVYITENFVILKEFCYSDYNHSVEIFPIENFIECELT